MDLPIGRWEAYPAAVATGTESLEGETMDVLVLRLIHIGAGSFWVGAVFTFFLFVSELCGARRGRPGGARQT